MDFIPKEQEPVAIDYPYDYDQSLNGIGGWLVVVIIGRILGIILGIKAIADGSRAIGIVPALDGILTAGVIFEVLSIIFSLLILVLIFSRNILFRILFVIQVSAGLIYSLIVIIYINSLGYSIGNLQFVGSLISCAIWISYLYKSKRIKNTYIYPKLYPYRYEDLNY